MKTQLLKRNYQERQPALTIAFTLILFLLLIPMAEAQTGVEPSGTGDSGDPYLIATLENLIWVQQNSSSWSQHFKQTADIDLISISNWTPIGNSTNFTGTYDGDGNVIRNLQINRPNDNYQGFFGNCGSATLRNIRLENVDIRGNRWVGGLAGRIAGSIENSSVTGTVRGSREYVGGLVGQGSSANLANKLVFIGLVEGGIVADESGNNVGIGGIVGRSSGSTSVSIAYVRGTVRGNYAGGLVGSSSTVASTFSQAYAAVDVGTVRSGQNLGGALIGRVDAAGDVINNSVYWDESLFSNVYGLIREGSPQIDAIGLTTDQMQGASASDPEENSMDNFDWSSGPWRTVTIPEDDYPVFEWQVGEIITLSGTVTGPDDSVIEGVTVTAQSSDANLGSVTAVTNSSGFYTMDVYSVPTARIFARSLEGDLPIGASEEGPFSASATIDLQLLPQSITIGTTANNGWIRDGNEILAVEEYAVLNVNTLRDELLNGDRVLVAGVDIIFDAELAPALTTERTLTLKAGGDIVLQPDSEIKPTDEALNLVFWSDITGSELGGVFLDRPEITTNNGHLWIGGGSGSTTWNGLTVGNSFASFLRATETGVASTLNGVNIEGATINTGNGDIYISGKSNQIDYRFGIGTRFNSGNDINANNITIYGIGSANNNSTGDNNRANRGVSIGETTITASGDIHIEGNGGGQDAGENGGENYGIRMNSTATLISTGSGNITLIGTGGGNSSISGNTDNDGLRIDGSTIRVNTGTIVLNGTAGTNDDSEDIVYTGNAVTESRNPSNNLTNGSIEIIANTLELATGVSLQSDGGYLSIQPRTETTTISIANTTGTLQLPASYFEDNFAAGFSQITIGSPTQTGNITLNSISFRDDMRLQTGGKVVVNGNQTITLPNGVRLQVDNDLQLGADAKINVQGD